MKAMYEQGCQFYLVLHQKAREVDLVICIMCSSGRDIIIKMLYHQLQIPAKSVHNDDFSKPMHFVL